MWNSDFKPKDVIRYMCEKMTCKFWQAQEMKQRAQVVKNSFLVINCYSTM